jgi:hypothetical protein
MSTVEALSFDCGFGRFDTPPLGLSDNGEVASEVGVEAISEYVE